MTRTAKILTAAAGALALVCLLLITTMAFSANQSRKATASQDYGECIDRSFRTGSDISVCGDRLRASAR